MILELSLKKSCIIIFFSMEVLLRSISNPERLMSIKILGINLQSLSNHGRWMNNINSARYSGTII
jgi:hypothetical protein